MSIFDKIGEGIINIKEKLVKEKPSLSSPSRKEPLPTKKEQGAIDLLSNECDEIRELAYDFIDALRDTMGKAHSRQNVLAAQEEFYAAVAQYVAVLTADEVRRAHEQSPSLLSFLELGHYTWPDQVDKEQVDDLAKSFAAGGDLENRQRSAGAAHEAQLAYLERHGYKGKDLEYALEAARHQINSVHLGTEAALHHLAEFSPEMEARFRDIIHLPLASFVEELEAILGEAAVEMHIEQGDFQNPIFRGVRECVHYALLEKADRWRSEAAKTIAQPFTYSIEHSEEVTRAESLDEIDRALQDSSAIEKRARYEKEKIEKRVKTLQTYDLFFSELQRYASHGKEPLPPQAPVEPSDEWKQEISEWTIGTVDAEDLRADIRKLVESIRQKDAQNILLQKRQKLIETLTSQYEMQRGHHPLQERFFELFFKTLEEAGSSWRDSHRGRDKLYFLQRDIQEEAESKAIEARVPLERFSDNIVMKLTAERAENDSFVSTMHDLEDIVDHPEIFKKIDTLGKRLSLAMPDLLRKAAHTSLINAQKEYHARLRSMPKPSDPEFMQPHYRMLREWYRVHPIARWQGAA